MYIEWKPTFPAYLRTCYTNFRASANFPTKLHMSHRTIQITLLFCLVINIVINIVRTYVM